MPKGRVIEVEGMENVQDPWDLSIENLLHAVMFEEAKDAKRSLHERTDCSVDTDPEIWLVRRLEMSEHHSRLSYLFGALVGKMRGKTPPFKKGDIVRINPAEVGGKTPAWNIPEELRPKQLGGENHGERRYDLFQEYVVCRVFYPGASNLTGQDHHFFLELSPTGESRREFLTLMPARWFVRTEDGAKPAS